MKKFLIGSAIGAAVLGFTAFGFAQARPVTLKVGSTAPKMEVGKWIKGKAVPSFKKGHVYVVEFWATWCPPCRESIPHLTELAKKYKNITFVGVSVAEENQAKVAPFVKSMGDKMDYHVAIDKQKSPTARVGYMAEHWMMAAGQEGIPTAFIIGKDQKIKWIGSPFVIDHELATISSH